MVSSDPLHRALVLAAVAERRRDHGQRADALLGGLAAGAEDRLDPARVVGGDGDPRDRVDEQDDVGTGLRLAAGPPERELDEAELLAGAHLGGGDGEVGARSGLAPGGDLLGPLVDQQDDELDVGAARDRAGERPQQGRAAGAGAGVDEDPLPPRQRHQQVDRAQQDRVLGGAVGGRRQVDPPARMNRGRVAEPRPLARRARRR